MKYPIYSIRDVKVGFGTPNIDQSDASAIRGFSYAINNREGLMNYSPKDFDLYKIGEFDVDSGTIKAEKIPVLVVNGSDVIEDK